MEIAAGMARLGNRVLSFIAVIMIALLFLYGGYSLWDTSMVYRGAFVSSDLLKFKPSIEEAEDNPTIEELQAINGDVRGWLTIDGTHIDYPVVQGKTDMDYINKDVYGEFSLSGAVFLSCLNSSDFSDRYNLVYGHHMDNGGMFGDVVKFSEQKYFEEHLTGNLFLPDKTYGITIFACVETDASDPVIYNLQNQGIEKFGRLLEYIGENAVQFREIGVTEEDRIVGLSTCAEAETNGRVVVFGRLDKISQAQEGGASN